MLTCWQRWQTKITNWIFLKQNLFSCWQFWRAKNHKEKSFIWTTRMRKFVDLLTKLRDKNHKLKNFESELVDLLTNLTRQKSQRKNYILISKERKFVDLLTKKNFVLCSFMNVSIWGLAEAPKDSKNSVISSISMVLQTSISPASVTSITMASVALTFLAFSISIFFVAYDLGDLGKLTCGLHGVHAILIYGVFLRFEF